LFKNSLWMKRQYLIYFANKANALGQLKAARLSLRYSHATLTVGDLQR